MRNSRSRIALGAVFVSVVTSAAHAQSPGVTTKASVSSAGAEGNGDSLHSAVSDDGRYVAFDSDASNLVLDDAGGTSDVFVRDRLAQTTERVSVASDGQEARGDSRLPSISGDGRYVAFESSAPRLVPDDTNQAADIFVHDRVTHVTTRVSVASDGGQANGPSTRAAISRDGRYVAFDSEASNLVTNPGDGNKTSDVFVHDRVSGSTTRVSRAADGGDADYRSYEPAISSDGRWIAFTSFASNLVSDGQPDGWWSEHVFLHDREAQTTIRVGRGMRGGPPDGPSGSPSISGDGRFIAFTSMARNLVEHPAFWGWHIFVFDRVEGTMEIVGRERAITGCGRDGQTFPCEARGSYNPAISADGHLVAFESDSMQLLPANLYHGTQVYLFDRLTRSLRRISVDATGAEGDSCTVAPAISATGAVVAYKSSSTTLPPTNANPATDVFVAEWACRNGESGPLPHGCNPDPSCPPHPAACTPAQVSRLVLRKNPPRGALTDRLDWTWKSEAPVDPATFGDPATTAYRLCVYADRRRALEVEADVPAGGGCADASCWQEIPAGWKLVGGGPAVHSLVVRGGAKPRIALKGAGAALDLPYAPLDDATRVAVRFHVDGSPSCFGANFPVRSFQVNVAGQHRPSEGDLYGRFVARVP